ATEDVIFCRNVLIYFTEEARQTALGNVARLLDPEGILYVGHTEAKATLDPRFRPLSPEYPFALGLAREGTEYEVPSTERPVLSVLPQREVRIASPNPVLGTLYSPPPPPESNPLALAQERADAGQLDEAALLCEQLLRRRPPPVAALYLLGVVRQAQGRLAEARRCYDQVLYLEPTHHEALIHLALLAESDGDGARAAHYRRRAGRARR